MRVIMVDEAGGVVFNGDNTLLKSHVQAYTRSDGTFVKEHDDKRQKKLGDSNSFGNHPHVVGHAEKLQGGDATQAHGFHFAGKEYSASGKTGTSMHDQTPVRHFKEVTEDGADSGQHVWLDGQSQVHADSSDEVDRLRSDYQKHTGGGESDAGGKSADVSDSDIELMESSLSNDEDSTDDELVEHFVNNGVPEEQAKAAVKFRDKFMNGVMESGSLKEMLSGSSDGHDMAANLPKPATASGGGTSGGGSDKKVLFTKPSGGTPVKSNFQQYEGMKSGIKRGILTGSAGDGGVPIQVKHENGKFSVTVDGRSHGTHADVDSALNAAKKAGAEFSDADIAKLKDHAGVKSSAGKYGSDSDRDTDAPSAGGSHSLADHADALAKLRKPGDMDYDDFQIAAKYMKKGDANGLKGFMQNLDTAARDDIMAHIHPDLWDSVGVESLDKKRSLDNYSKKFGQPSGKKPGPGRGNPRQADPEGTRKAGEALRDLIANGGAKKLTTAQVNKITDKHEGKMVRKGAEWDHNGYDGQKIPAADVENVPTFTHKEVYGHNGKTSPEGDDFTKEFAAKGHQGFVLHHPNGKKSFVDTQGYNYARYHGPVGE